ncbi:MAG TPA: hypothetical protein V6C81_10930 [Planktothrix sp.]|jgi:hypothetical protein
MEETNRTGPSTNEAAEQQRSKRNTTVYIPSANRLRTYQMSQIEARRERQRVASTRSNETETR